MEVHRQIYTSARNHVTQVIKLSKKRFCIDKIKSCSGNPKALFTFLDTLLGKTSNITLPDIQDDMVSANRFSDYFKSKIEDIRASLGGNNLSSEDFPIFEGQELTTFKPFSETEIRKIIQSLKTTSCEVDPIPTKLLLEHVVTLLPTITNIINASLSTGCVPKCFKKALVKPLIKKPNLDSEVLKNYRPVSNLPFISKILEKAVKIRLCEHLTQHDLIYEFQSAYRPGHSTETALNRVISDLLWAVDDGDVALLVLLDLSAAFDTIDHDQLVKRLNVDFGLDGTVLRWITSYLSDRFQSVVIGKTFSKEEQLSCGVPQGSVLGPILFTLYTKQLGNVLQSQNMNHHLYADDSQLMEAFNLLWSTSRLHFPE